MQVWKCLFGPETYGQTTAMYLCTCMWSHPSVATLQVIIKDGPESIVQNNIQTISIFYNLLIFVLNS